MSHAQILHPVDRFRSTLERIDDAPGRHWTTRGARLADDSDGGGEVAATSAWAPIRTFSMGVRMTPRGEEARDVRVGINGGPVLNTVGDEIVGQDPVLVGGWRHGAVLGDKACS
jgi:hypothetical protein